MATTTWRIEIEQEMEKQGESLSDVVSNTMSDEEMDFHFGGLDTATHMGKAFTVWTENRVYFPVEVDGFQWVASVSRHPDGKPTEHI